MMMRKFFFSIQNIFFIIRSEKTFPAGSVILSVIETKVKLLKKANSFKLKNHLVLEFLFYSGEERGRKNIFTFFMIHSVLLSLTHLLLVDLNDFWQNARFQS